MFVWKNAPATTEDQWFLHGHPYSKRFSNPTLVSLTALVEYNATKDPLQTAFLVPAIEKKDTPYQFITWAEFHEKTDSIAKGYARLIRL